MVKIIFFIIGILLIIFFPIFISHNEKKIILKNNVSLPLIEISLGRYKKYGNVLEINGTFLKANVYKDRYEFNNLVVNKLKNREKYFFKWALKKDKFLEGKNAEYRNEDYILDAKRVFYYEDKKFLRGWDFNFSSLNAKGEGKYFEVDKNRNLFAKNIFYIIKVKE